MRTTVKKYTLKSLLFDIIMLMLTGGLWVFWILIRHYHRGY